VSASVAERSRPPALKPLLPPTFNNRLAANWRLLLAIADHAGGDWPKRACQAAVHLSRRPYEPSVGVQLLAAFKAMLVNRTETRAEITSEQVVQGLLADPDSPWREYRGRGPITKNQVAVLLKDFEIRPCVLHPTKRADLSRHGYRAVQFEDAWARFLPSSRTSEHRKTTVGQRPRKPTAGKRPRTKTTASKRPRSKTKK
jgi:Protein of unknown function (DUF3631)